VSKIIVVMRYEIDPVSIRSTSDRFGIGGFRVVIRQKPANGSFGTGSKGAPNFTIAYRPGVERGRTVFRFHHQPGNEVRMAKVSAIVPPDEPYEVDYVDAAGKIATFEIHPDYFTAVIRSSGIRPVKLRQLPPAGFVTNRRVDSLCSLLMHETEAQAPLGRLYFDALAKALIIAVVSQTDVRLPEAGNLYIQHDRIQRAVSHLEANFQVKLTTEDLARVSNLSPFHFSRLFSRLVGLTPHEYILSCRLRFAARLLRGHSEYSVGDVAVQAGFADQSHFTKCFFRVFGKTPKAYRDELA
jgi:AraC-like DNA-binding protein